MSKSLLKIYEGASIERASFIKRLKEDGKPYKGTSGSIISKMDEKEGKSELLAQLKKQESELEEAEEALYDLQIRGKGRDFRRKSRKNQRRDTNPTRDS